MRRRVLVWAGVAALVVALAASVLVLPAVVGSRSVQRPQALPLLQIRSAHGDSFVPVLNRTRPLFILVLGSDARPGERAERLRADSIHLVGIDVKRGRATILGFPRDSWVGIPGYGTTKINNGMVLGGPELMVETIESLTGVRIDFWVLTSFGGFVNMVDAVGPLTVDVDRAMFDSFSGTHFSAGSHRFDGKDALAFARDRHSTAGGDFGRSQNQGKLMVAALRKLRTDFGRNPALLFAWMTTGWRNIQTNLAPRTLLELALTATRIKPARVDNLVVPGSAGSAGSASVVFISSGAQSIYADLRDDGVLSDRGS